MTAIEIIKETAQYYKEHPRGLGEEEYSACQYLTTKGNKCAVGRVIKDELFDDKLISTVFSGGVVRLKQNLRAVGIEFEDALKPEYQGQSLRFWEDLQTWHDGSSNWLGGNKTQNLVQVLSLRGEENLNELLTIYS